MRAKSIRQFIRENKEEIDRHIKEAVPNCPESINNREREAWIMNDETLYQWAQVEGVKI